MAIEYTPQYSLLTTVTNAGTFAVQVTSLPPLAVGSIVSVSGLTSASVSLSGSSVISISGLTSASVTATNAGTFAVQVTSLPSLAFGQSVTITNGAILSVTNLLSTLSTVTNEGVFAVQVTSLPSLAYGNAVSVTNLVSVLATVTNAGTFAISSLPDFAIGKPVLATCTNAGTFAVQITSLPSLAFGQTVTITNGAIVSVSNGTIVSVTNLVSTLATVTNAGTFTVQVGANSNYWSFTSTYTAAQTNAVLKSEPSSTTAYYITDVIFSNCATQGDFSLVESRTNAGIKVKLDGIYLMDRGGMVANLRTPIVLDTNAALCMTTRSVTSHSVTVIGYSA